MPAAPYESAPYDIADRPVTIDRRQGHQGEVVLRRRGQEPKAIYEIIANGCFLMDTSDGRSERLLIRVALAALADSHAHKAFMSEGPGPDGRAPAPTRRSTLMPTRAPALPPTPALPPPPTPTLPPTPRPATVELAHDDDVNGEPAAGRSIHGGPGYDEFVHNEAAPHGPVSHKFARGEATPNKPVSLAPEPFAPGPGEADSGSSYGETETETGGADSGSGRAGAGEVGESRSELGRSALDGPSRGRSGVGPGNRDVRGVRDVHGMGALHGTPGVGERPVGEGSGGRAFGPAVLIGGLGVGFSLLEAVADHRWGRIVVVEREQAVIEWHLRGPLGALSAQALADPRTEILHTDLVAYLRGAPAVSAAYATPAAATPPVDLGPSGHAQRYDALCLDIDNGPDWTVTEDNGGLYSPAGLAACRERLNPGGVLAIWSAQPSFEFEEALRNAGFTSVRTEEIIVARGVPDVVHLAIRGA